MDNISRTLCHLGKEEEHEAWNLETIEHPAPSLVLILAQEDSHDLKDAQTSRNHRSNDCEKVG